MHYPLASLRLAFLAFTIFSAAFASNIEDALQKRQSPAPSGTGSSASQTSSATSASPTTSSTQPTPPSQSSSPSPSSTPSPSITPTPGTTLSVTPQSSTPTATPTIIIQTLTTSATKQIVTTLMSVDSSGTTIQQILTTSGLVAVGTSVTTSTSFPGINNNGEPSGSSGLSSQQKKIIIGVVVGVGGFVILGGMALVAWRVWGRKKQPLEDDDRAHTATPDARPGPGGSPFKSTLDQYHNPGTVNTASNF